MFYTGCSDQHENGRLHLCIHTKSYTSTTHNEKSINTCCESVIFAPESSQDAGGRVR